MSDAEFQKLLKELLADPFKELKAKYELAFGKMMSDRSK